MRDVIAFDFETFYDTKAGYSVGGHGSKPGMSISRYIRDARFDPYWVALHSADLHYSGPTCEAPWESLIGRPLAAHNAGFDLSILQHLQKQGKIPQLRTPSVYDTADAVAFLQEPRSLEQSAKSVLGVTHSKSVRNAMDGRHFSSLSPAEVSAMRAYGGGDAQLCWELWKHTHTLWPAEEQEFSALTRSRGQEGLYLDREALETGIQVLEMAHFETIKAMPWVRRGGKPLSLEAMREQGRYDNIPVPASIKMDDPDAVLWEETYSKDYPWVAAVRGFRRINSLLLKLQRWLEDIREDGTAPFSLKYFGAAATGRFSGSGGFNIQNLPKKPVLICKKCWSCRLEKIDDNSDIGDDYSVDDPCPICGEAQRHVIDIRGLIKAPPGQLLVVADYAQIEARILLWRVKDTVTLDLVRGGLNLYEAYARVNLGWKGEAGTLKASDPDTYALAKASRLGGGFGCGKVGFNRAAKQLVGLDLPPEQCEAAVKTFRETNPLIVQHWRWHEDWFRVSAIQKDKTHEVVLPSGRHIRYFNPRFHTKPDKEGRERLELIAEIVKGARGGKGTNGQTRTFFGGKLTENEIQAIARDVMRDGVLAGEKLGIRTLFTVHDELVTTVPADRAEEAVKELTEALPIAAKWLPGCPLDTETYVADRYRK